MKKALVALSLVIAILGAVVPTASKADSFSFSISDGPDYYGPRHSRGWDGPRHHGWHHRHHYPRPVFYAPPPVIYAPPVRTVVYTAPAEFIPAPTMIADQSSPTYYNEYGQQCREYQTTGRISGSRGQLYGTACLQPDGSWRVID